MQTITPAPGQLYAFNWQPSDKPLPEITPLLVLAILPDHVIYIFPDIDPPHYGKQMAMYKHVWSENKAARVLLGTVDISAYL